MTREEILNGSMTQPETLKVGGVVVRKLSLRALATLARIGNPFGDLLKNGAALEKELDASALAEAIFVCSAERGRAETLVASGNRTAFAEAAQEWCERFTLAEVGRIMRFMIADHDAARVAQAEAVPEHGGGGSKNAQSPAE